MTRDPQSIQPDKAFGHAMLMMYEGGFRHVPVEKKAIHSVWFRRDAWPGVAGIRAELSNREHIREILG
jgi:hypothetical protein